MSSVDRDGQPGKSRKPDGGESDPRYISLRPGALAVTQLPAYSFEVEQYRNLSLEIEERFDPEDDGSHVLVIAGPDPNSGKTLTSLNLALILARRSEREVLLVEGDLWKPSFGSLFQLQAETLGLTDLLRDVNLDLKDALLSVWGTGLSVLAAGQRAGEGDRVTSRRMDDLVVAMKSRFDLVVFDTPPIGLASGRYLAGLADSVVIVVRARKTERDLIRDALENLQPETVVGLMLNDVQKRERHYAYYSSYVSYYGANRDEKPLGWSRGFWKRPLAGLAWVGTALGAVAASVFAIARGKPAEAELEPAWIVAGILLILTVTSWAFLLGKRVQVENERTPAVASALVQEELEPGGTAEAGEESSLATPLRVDPDAHEPVAEQDALDIALVAPPDLQEQQGTVPISRERGITITSLNIRRQPALDGDYLTTLPRGSSFEVLDQAEDWYLVRAGAHTGWVAKLGTQIGSGVASTTDEVGSVARFDAPVRVEVPAGGARTSTNLNLRRQPGRTGEYMTTLPEGTRLEVLEERGDWYRVSTDEKAGWVFKRGVVGAPVVSPTHRLETPADTPEAPAQPGFAWAPPKFLSWKAPSYETTADSKGFGETLTVSIHVTATGSVLEVTLADDSKTDAAFNEVVLESLRTATFRPAFRNGVAVAAWHKVRVKYQESP